MKYNWINTEMFVLQAMETSVVYAYPDIMNRHRTACFC